MYILYNKQNIFQIKVDIINRMMAVLCLTRIICLMETGLRRCVLCTFALSRHDNDLHENKPGGQRDSTFYKIDYMNIMFFF